MEAVGLGGQRVALAPTGQNRLNALPGLVEFARLPAYPLPFGFEDRLQPL